MQNLLLKYSDSALEHFRPLEIPASNFWQTVKTWYKTIKYFFS